MVEADFSPRLKTGNLLIFKHAQNAKSCNLGESLHAYCTPENRTLSVPPQKFSM
jgi:hypothetical protein